MKAGGGYSRLDAPPVINRNAVAELVEPVVHLVPEVATLMNDLYSAFRDARKPGDVPLSCLAVDALALDEDGSPSDILPDRPISAPTCTQEAPALVADPFPASSCT